MTAPDVLDFADKKTDGAYAVTEPSGAPVAWLQVSSWTGASFSATTASGEPLCTGRRTGFFSVTWEAVDPGGRVLGSVRSAFWGNSKVVTLADGRTLTLRGQLFGRDWSLIDGSGRDVLSSTPTSSGWSFRPDAWLVRCHDLSLSLAEVVAVVQLNRMMVKSSRASASSSNNMIH